MISGILLGAFWEASGALLAPFGLLWGLFGALLASFWVPLPRLGCLWAPSGAFLCLLGSLCCLFVSLGLHGDAPGSSFVIILCFL